MLSCVPKPLKKDVPVCTDSQMAWNMWTVTLWLVHFAERIGGKLSALTVFNLIANISYAVITVALFYFFLVVCVSPWHSDALFAT